VSSLFPYIFLLLLLLFPAGNLPQFNGLPLSRWTEFLGLAFLLPFLFSGSLRDKAAELFSRIRFSLPLFYATGVIVLFLKVGLLMFGSRDGFIGCYYSPAAWAPGYPGTGPSLGCERSYEDLFRRSLATRTDRTISFDPDSWNLTFLNSLRFDYPASDPSSIPRSRIPITATWVGFLSSEKASRVVVRYTGKGFVTVGSVVTLLPASYDRVNEITLNLPAGRQNFLVQYSFDDGSRMGQAEDTWGPGAQLHVVLAGASGEQPLRVTPPGLPWKLAAGGADVLFLLLLLVPLISILAGLWREKWVVLALAVFLAVCYLLPLSQRVREMGMNAGLAGFWLWHCLRKPVRPLTVYAVLLSVAVANTLLFLPAPNQVILRSAQDDPLNYESEAYSILSSGSLEGGEKVFIYQPLFRYIKFGEHAVFGDGMTFPVAAQLAFFLGGAFFLGDKVLRRGVSRPGQFVVAAVTSAILFLGGYYVSIVIRAGLSEYMTWSLLLWALPPLFLDETAASCLLGVAALAFSFTIRTNQLPAVLWMAFWALNALRRKDRRASAFGWILFAGICLLPLAHNLYYGHEFVFATTSGGLAINLPVPPSTWLAFLRGDAPAAAAVAAQLKQMFLLADVALSTRITLAAMAALLAVWLAVAVFTGARRRISDWALWAVPLFYLAPHLFFAVNIYYPRLIFIGYLAMGAVAAVWLARNPPPAAAQTVPAATK
jgi:hypothetical protein